MTKKLFANYSTLNERGALPYQLGTAWCWFAKDEQGKYIWEEVAMSAVRNAAAQNPDDPSPFVANIEQWDPRDEWDKAIKELTVGLCGWRAHQPKREIGLYRITPRYDYWKYSNFQAYLRSTSVSEYENARESLISMMNYNTDVRNELGRFIDFVVPKAYPIYEGQLGRFREATYFQVQETKRLYPHLPCRPIITPVYRGVGPALSLEDWEGLCEFIFAMDGVDDVFLYLSSSFIPSLPAGWDDVLARAAGLEG